jgi:MFS superfamily sulfate permease-like transporter
MIKVLLLFCFFIYVAISATSYSLVAGGQADWWQLVTYLWVFFWPVVILLGLLYYNPLAFLAVLVASIGGWLVWRKRT